MDEREMESKAWMGKDGYLGRQERQYSGCKDRQWKPNKKKIKKLLADGLHDDKKTFNLLGELGIEPVIKIRENASIKARGSIVRKKEVIEYKKVGDKKWAQEKCYGERWLCTEGIFSAIKRIFGETLHASKTSNIYHEARLKLWSYNQLKSLV